MFQMYGTTICFRGTDEFFWKILILKNNHPEGVFAPRDGGNEGSLLKKKLYIDWIFRFQSKILSFAMISFHQISLSTFIRNFARFCNVKKFEKFECSRCFQSRTFKNNINITGNIIVILKPEQSFYDDLFKRYRLHRLTN